MKTQQSFFKPLACFSFLLVLGICRYTVKAFDDLGDTDALMTLLKQIHSIMAYMH